MHYSLSCIHVYEWEGEQKVKQAHHTSVPSDCATKWDIHPDLLRPVFNHWGQPWIDLFATFSKKCHQFISPFLAPGAVYIDALSIPWNQMGTVYAFPPFKIIPTVIAKCRQSESITLILIAQYRMDTSWMQELLQLSRNSPIHVRDKQKLLTHSSHSSNRWRSQNPDLPVLKSSPVETLKALYRKLGYDSVFRVSELMTSTLLQ